MIKRAIYAGTFDPITVGHFDIISRAVRLFDEVIIGVAKSERKSPHFDLAQRMAMVRTVVANLDTVIVKEFSDLTINFAKQHHAQFLVRGLRTAKDYDYEAELACMNRLMSDEQLETVLLPAKPEYAYISSSIVRELISMKAYDKLSAFVPESILCFVS